MRYQYKSSFAKTIKKLTPERKERVISSIESLVTFFQTRQRTEGLGLKKLQREFWEIRTDLKDRVLFRLKDDLVEFVICGNHEDIKRYLNQI